MYKIFVVWQRCKLQKHKITTFRQNFYHSLARNNERKIDIVIIAKLRCGNFEKDNKYWLKEDERLCRIYEKDGKL